MPPATDYDVLVLGAGAAGMLCAVRAAERGKRVLVLEKNTKPGVKILMSGGTRCNLTHSASASEIADAYARLVGGAEGKAKARFLRTALGRLTPDSVVAMFAAEGLATKIEATGKVFPASDRALDVQRTLLRMLDRAGASLALGEGVTSLERNEEGYVVTTTKRTISTPKLVIAVGGQSYPGCGTTGDGYAWAKALGHRIAPPRPALVPLTSHERWACELQGVTLSDVRVRLQEGDMKPVADRRGSFLFTHFGLSGPAVMDASRFVTERPGAGWQAVCDFVPSLDEQHLLDALQASGARGLLNVVAEWTPRRLAESIVTRAGAPLDRKLAELSKLERRAVIDGLKRSAIPLVGSLGFKKAEVTAGGVDLSEIDPKTMESRLSPGAYFIGEVLDLDGPIGGYNFQAAFSTGALAGDSV
ncbi:NAD(P)/FAD-dependent oxidoreductase [Botrimarina mediterranea]|uniref:N-methyltryptophan oxidase n=1 Tax=Botrimarina mediterranea TaxID=2528022 RepID=A0A518K2C8_9BACT|nr:aminoacetone oxidase family FAD-binding enzyme [Botrimarina mediterranea]QDV71968.1 N-methyltryptophan oxidase [Botrimarina mediterranea]QDV76509.1 N-methyltryptophan oxidase [Planctomycetes bacterium K2D]